MWVLEPLYGVKALEDQTVCPALLLFYRVFSAILPLLPSSYQVIEQRSMLCPLPLVPSWILVWKAVCPADSGAHLPLQPILR